MKVRIPQSRGLRAVLALGVVLLLLALDGAYAGLRFRSSFKAAACNLKKATDRIEEFDVATGLDRLRRAEELVTAARGYLGHPAVAIATYLPLISDDVRALKALTGIAREAVQAGLEGADAAEAMGLSDEGSLSAIYSDGRVQFDALDTAAQAIGDGLKHLVEAQRIADDSPRPSIGQVRSAFFSAQRLLVDAREQLDTAQRLLAALPGILGDGSPRRYLLAFQTPSEARGGGGLIGVYGILNATEGRLSLEKVAPIRELVPKMHGVVDAADWFRAAYEDTGGLQEWRSPNLSPTFPEVAGVWLQMYERSVGDVLDGVIAMDPFVVGELTRGTGPISVEGSDAIVGPDNAAEVLLKDIYLEFEGREDEQNAYLRDLVDELWRRLGKGDVDGEALAEGIARSIRTQHLKVYSTDASEEQTLVDVGVGGDPTRYGPNVQMIFHNNYAANKIDYFLERSQDVNVVIDENGDGHIVTTVELFNNAPRGERSLLKKSDLNELPSGLNRMSLHFMLPEGATVKELFTGGVSNSFFEDLEAGVYPTAWRLAELQVQERIQLSVSYDVEDMVVFDEDEGTLEMTFLPQVLVNPDTFELKIVPPPGYRIGRDEPGARFSTEPFTYAGELKSPKTFALDLIGPDGNVPSETSLGSACG